MYDIAESPVHPPHPSTYHHLPVQSCFARTRAQANDLPPVYYSCMPRRSSIDTIAAAHQREKTAAQFVARNVSSGSAAQSYIII